MDTLLSDNERFESQKSLSVLREMRLKKDDSREMAALLLKPGIPFGWYRKAFQWSRHQRPWVKEFLASWTESEGEVLIRMVQENVASITADDGLARLRALKWGGIHDYRGGIPHWSHIALRDMRDRLRMAWSGCGSVIQARDVDPSEPLPDGRI